MEKTINEKISEFRKARNLTQEQLGAKLGISGQAVSKWEKGESLPDIMLLPELCDIFGVSIDALLEVPAAVKNKNIMQDFCTYAAIRFDILFCVIGFIMIWLVISLSFPFLQAQSYHIFFRSPAQTVFISQKLQ